MKVVYAYLLGLHVTYCEQQCGVVLERDINGNNKGQSPQPLLVLSHNYYNIVKLKTTTNYALFEEIEGNRNAKSRNDLENSFRTYGWIYPIICVLINGVLRIIDGQHRFLTAKAMGLPIKYIEFNGLNQDETINLIATLNNTSKAWSPYDYVVAWAATGKYQYQRVLDYARDFNLTVTTVMILTTVDYHKSRIAMRTGNLELDAKNTGRTTMNYIVELRNVMPFTNRMVEGFHKFYLANQQGFNLKKFKEKLEEHSYLLYDITERHVFAKMFQEIYNK